MPGGRHQQQSPDGTAAPIGQQIFRFWQHRTLLAKVWGREYVDENEYLKVLVQLADTKRSQIVANYELGFARSRLRTLLRWDASKPLRLTEELVRSELPW